MNKGSETVWNGGSGERTQRGGLPETGKLNILVSLQTGFEALVLTL